MSKRKMTTHATAFSAAQSNEKKSGVGRKGQLTDGIVCRERFPAPEGKEEGAVFQNGA
jgi:hypothetical protein